MQSQINQAVVFTKPIHHLELPLMPEQLASQLKSFLEKKGFTIVRSKTVSGSDLAERDIIKQHYLMYSQAACCSSVEQLSLSNEAKAKFETSFDRSWAIEAGKVFGSPALQAEKGITAHELYLLWNDKFSSRQTQKLQDGIIMAWLPELDCYCINAFYPAMEENFYDPATEITYSVIEFDPDRISWAQFRKSVLGATDASKADPESFRGELYTTYGTSLEFPGRDNFVHGSAGPFEGLIERTIHESDFDMTSNPVGRYFLSRDIDLERLKQWRMDRTIIELGELFDATEERNTDEILGVLNGIQF